WPDCKWCIVTTIIVLLTSLIARAATLTTTAAKDGKIIVILNGEITEGDADALKTIIQTANNGGHLVAIIRLDSPGGSILEGVNDRIDGPMSAFGTKRTCSSWSPTSAFGGIADVDRRCGNVRFDQRTSNCLGMQCNISSRPEPQRINF